MSNLFADLSNNDSHFDAVSYRKAGHRLLGVKATEGVSFNDPAHTALVTRCRSQRIAVAHYHFARPDNNGPVAEARHFWKVVGPLYKNGDYVVLDLEVRSPGGPAATVRWAKAFSDELRRISGHRPVLYTSQSWLVEIGPVLKSIFGRRRIWMAQYAQHPTPPSWARPLWAWQRTGDGQGRGPQTLPGCPANCDVSSLNRLSYLRLRRLCG